MRKLTRIALACFLATALAACGSGDGTGQGGDVTTVKIAGLWPLSGANATQGTDVLHGAELAVEIINAAHADIDLPLAAEAGLTGLDGATIELITGDTQGKPEVGASEVDRLVNSEEVAAIVGCYQSGVTLTASQRAERLGVPFLNASSSSTALTERGYQWFVRTGPNDKTFAGSMFDYLEERREAGDQVETIGIFNSNDQYGNDGAKVTREVAAEYGMEVVAEVAVDPNAADLSSQVTQIRSANPDALFVLLYTDAAIKLIRTMEQLGYYPPSLLAYGAGFADPAFREGLGELADGVSSRAAWSAEIAETRPAAKAVAEMFQETYDAPMTENSARAFSGMMALAQAINDAGSTEPAAIRDALKALDVPGEQTIMPWDGIRFGDDGQNEGAKGVVEQMVDGEYRVVFPTDISSVEPVWPMSEAGAP